MPREVASACLVIHNDPLAQHPLDATGFLTLDRLDVLIEALMGVSAGEWMIAYWDGWSGIGPALRGTFGDRVFSLNLPRRGYLAAHAPLQELHSFSHVGEPYVGPSLVAATDRSALVVGDVDWSITYLGVSSGKLGEEVQSVFAWHGLTVDATCDPLKPLPGFEVEADA
ncbi:MAG: hypothetical protein ACREJP_04675 [Candidatus Methylomirabilales bacterium]